jgi:nitrite reductase/ring-hydroxylating ferredoxin subunit
LLSREENDLLTRTGRGTPCGELMRRYWQPAALSEELPLGGAPMPVRLLGEDLALFRDDQGQPGLIGLHCPHRGADLSYGRLEDGGLRCIYHGWLFDTRGSCLEQPGEPAGSEFYRKIHMTGYPCQEAAGIIFAYLGPGEPPLLPAYEFLTVPDEQRYVTKALHECNYLQGNEGNIDPPHLSFLHRMFREGDGWAPPTPVQGGLASANTLFGRDPAPTLEVQETEFGLLIFAVRDGGADERYLRISNFILPNLSAFPGGGASDGYGVNWHVPIDDDTNWKFNITFRRRGPIDKALLKQRIAQLTPDYRLVRNRSNRYLQDRDEMKDRTFSGLGTSFMVHDACATETMGHVQERGQEHLGHTDRAIIAARLQLLQAIRQVAGGREAPHVVREPGANCFPLLGAVDAVISASADWRTCWREILLGAMATAGRAT